MQKTGTRSPAAVGTASLPRCKWRCFLFKHGLRRAKRALGPLAFLIITQSLENQRGQGDADFLLNFLKFNMFQDHPSHFPPVPNQIHVFWGDWGKIRILVLPVWTPRVEAWLEILWAEFSYRTWLSHIRPILHLAGTSQSAKASSRWAEGHPSPSVTAPSLLSYSLLLWTFIHSSRADVGL